MLYPNPQKFSQLKCFFVHVPKNGGTSVEQTLKDDGQTTGGHSTALAMRQKWPEEWGHYFTFAIVRDPLTRFLSAWKYLRFSPIHPNLYNEAVHCVDTLEGFVDLMQHDTGAQGIVHLLPQHQFVCDQGGKVMVDFVGRHERLPEDWKVICDRLGIHKPLPHFNKSKSTSVNLHSLEKSREFVRNHYAMDYEVFGY